MVNAHPAGVTWTRFWIKGAAMQMNRIIVPFGTDIAFVVRCRFLPGQHSNPEAKLLRCRPARWQVDATVRDPPRHQGTNSRTR